MKKREGFGKFSYYRTEISIRISLLSGAELGRAGPASAVPSSVTQAKYSLFKYEREDKMVTCEVLAKKKGSGGETRQHVVLKVIKKKGIKISN